MSPPESTAMDAFQSNESELKNSYDLCTTVLSVPPLIPSSYHLRDENDPSATVWTANRLVPSCTGSLTNRASEVSICTAVPGSGAFGGAVNVPTGNVPSTATDL